MNIIYLKTADNWQDIAKNKWIYMLRRIFHIPKTHKTYPNTIEYILPYKAVETKKIKRFLKCKKSVQGIVLEQKLLNNTQICNQIKEKNIYLFNGKWLFKYLVLEVIQYICEKRRVKIDTLNVAILIKNTTEDNIQAILKIAEKVKNISIITSEINKFSKIEKSLYEEKGIPIKISNNKKKSLKKENIIINMDFTEEDLKSYTICQEAIIINIKNNVNNINKAFHGININNFEIIRTEYDVQGFASNNTYESIIYRKDTFNNIKLQLKKDRIKIKYLIGQRGKIQENEYKEFL